MTKTYFFLLFIFISVTQSLIGQKISNVDFDEIKLKTEDSLSNTYYPKLLQRFQEFDSLLTGKDYQLIYYGSVFQSYYKPYGSSPSEREFNELYKQRKYKDAIQHGEEALKENPVNISLIYKMAVCHERIVEYQLSSKYAKQYYALLDVIYKSGDGKSKNTAYVVIKIADEYEIVSDLKLKVKSQSLIGGNTDLLRIDSKGQKKQKGQKKIKALYFNVSMPFGSLFKNIKEEE